MRLIRSLILSLAFAIGLTVIADKAEAKHCIQWFGSFCAAYAPDTLPGARDCTSTGAYSNEYAVYTGTNYSGFCMAFPAGFYASNLTPSGWQGTWNVSSWKKGSSLKASQGLSVCENINLTPACA